MGRWGRRGAGRPAEPREKLRASHSSYSDDYRVTPELLSDAHRHAHTTASDACVVEGDVYCSQEQRCCGDDTPCCSQEECCFSDPSRCCSPRRGRSASGGSRCGSFGGLDVVVVDEEHVDLCRQAVCTSCESCDTCHWTSESITRIELKNHLFTSPMIDQHTGHYDYRKGPTNPPTRAHNSPHRRCNTDGNPSGRVLQPLKNSWRHSIVENARQRA
ncbi:hypothetical protein OTU49_004664, partial [Cherax quadricarinatus]